MIENREQLNSPVQENTPNLKEMRFNVLNNKHTPEKEVNPFRNYSPVKEKGNSDDLKNILAQQSP